MGSNYSLKYNVDIAMCIDATGSMGGLLNTVKSNALSNAEKFATDKEIEVIYNAKYELNLASSLRDRYAKEIAEKNAAGRDEESRRKNTVDPSGCETKKTVSSTVL